uniref:Uncharacterized protein n=1 Tax=Leersia perrieri TaxID=77586 RepID=A0A0D9XAJ9_9ORYZ
MQGEGGGGIIISVAIRFGASRFEQLRVLRRMASIRIPIGAIAAVIRPAKRLAGAPASAAVAGAELGGAPLVEIDEAAGVRAVGDGGLDEHGEIVAVDEADKSLPSAPSSVNSARVAGGVAPAPWHSISPEPQSPVAQEPLPEEEKSQPDRPQKRPDHPGGA